MGMGFGRNLCSPTSTETHPRPSPPLEGEGIEKYENGQSYLTLFSVALCLYVERFKKEKQAEESWT
jgi:hypothetical protein